MKRLIGIVLGILILGAGAGYYMFNKPVDKTADLKAEVTIEAQALFEAFESDETNANKSYLDKIVEVTGVVEKIEDKNDLSNIYLATDDMMATILCQLENKADLKKVIKGNKATIKGVCSGYLSDVVLVRAVVQ